MSSAISPTGIGTGAILLGLASLLVKRYGRAFILDLLCTIRYGKASAAARAVAKHKVRVIDAWQEAVRRFADKPCLEGDDSLPLTFKQVDEWSNRVAWWICSRGFQQQTIGLFMGNRVEFVICWLGIHKAGGRTALLNTNLRGQALEHSIQVAKCQFCIVGLELQQAWEASVSEGFLQGIEYCVLSCFTVESKTTEDQQLRAGSTSFDDRWTRDVSCRDVLFYIYTSGTTGLPKAAPISNMRFVAAGRGFSAIVGIQSWHKVYCALPVYHSSGGMLGVSMCWFKGCCFHIAAKFSASKFFSECAKYDCNCIQYVGEMCRFLTNRPPSNEDKNHSINLAIGNGLAAEVWAEMNRRFEIPRISEFFAATEGNVVLVNSTGEVGAVGYIPRAMRPSRLTPYQLSPFRIIKFDVEKEEPVLDSKGRLTVCAPGEAGEIVGYINSKLPNSEFRGYTDPEATKRKIFRNGFGDGADWFRSGDLMKMDERGFVYFVDRIGDTFRWKGENVATSEVSQAVHGYEQVLQANVYGVAVPKCEGRAGMAAVSFNSSAPDLDGLARHLSHTLPAYARPQFLRIVTTQQITGTFKHRKVDLVKQGFDPSETQGDPVFIADWSRCQYTPVTPAVVKELEEGRRRM